MGRIEESGQDLAVTSLSVHEAVYGLKRRRKRIDGILALRPQALLTPSWVRSHSFLSRPPP
jgi:hypothetical protein